MKHTKVALILGMIGFFLALAPSAEARVGGGRSMGSRGSRGMGASRSYSGRQPATPVSPYNAAPARPYNNNPMGGGGMLRSLGYGLAGGMLGSMLFSGLSNAGGIGGMGGGGGGIGLLDIILLLGLGYVIYRFVIGRRRAGAGQTPTNFSAYSNPVAETPYVAPASRGSLAAEEAPFDVLARHESGFDINLFREARLDDFFAFQAAWGNRDLSPVRVRLTPEMADTLGREVADMRSQGRINRLDNIAVRDTELTEAWQDGNQLFATVEFRANLVDYTTDESGKILSGSRTDAVKFQEQWTFTRDVGFGSSSSQWRLSAIEQSA